MNELRKDGRWKFAPPPVLELRSGLIESMMMTRPIVRQLLCFRTDIEASTYGAEQY